MNPICQVCPICQAAIGEDCKNLPPGFQHGPRVLAGASAPRPKILRHKAYMHAPRGLELIQVMPQQDGTFITVDVIGGTNVAEQCGTVTVGARVTPVIRMKR